MLAVHTPDALRRAVSTEDLGALTMVPGIGRKGAQRIVLELKDRLGPPGEAAEGLPGARPTRQSPRWRDQVQSGLVNLGWPARDADQAIAALEDEGVINGDDAAVDVAIVLRAALRKLSRQ
jgi:Holliday junction DNA helicase RuvA